MLRILKRLEDSKKEEKLFTYEEFKNDLDAFLMKLYSSTKCTDIFEHFFLIKANVSLKRECHFGVSKGNLYVEYGNLLIGDIAQLHEVFWQFDKENNSLICATTEKNVTRFEVSCKTAIQAILPAFKDYIPELSETALKAYQDQSKNSVEALTQSLLDQLPIFEKKDLPDSFIVDKHFDLNPRSKSLQEIVQAFKKGISHPSHMDIKSIKLMRRTSNTFSQLNRPDSTQFQEFNNQIDHLIQAIKKESCRPVMPKIISSRRYEDREQAKPISSEKKNNNVATICKIGLLAAGAALTVYAAYTMNNDDTPMFRP